MSLFFFPPRKIVFSGKRRGDFGVPRGIIPEGIHRSGVFFKKKGGVFIIVIVTISNMVPEGAFQKEECGFIHNQLIREREVIT